MIGGFVNYLHKERQVLAQVTIVALVQQLLV
jgi:hypothetical protein